MPEAVYHTEDDTVNYTPTAAISAGAVVRLPDGRTGVVKTDLAANEQGSAYVRGIFKFAKTADIVLLGGQLAWWDASADTATFELGGDFPAGVVVSHAAASDTTVKVSINASRYLDIDLFRDQFTAEATNGLGATRLRGEETLAFDAVAEVAQAALVSERTILGSGGPVLEAVIAVFDIGNATNLDINFGLASGSHATDFDAITSYAAFHLNGNALDLFVHSDDNVTDTAETDTTVNVVDDTYIFAQIDARDPADVKFYVNGVAVNDSTTFAIAAATAHYAIVHLEKTSDDTVADVRVKALRAYRTNAAG